ncbi:MAG: segregation/condensation protein A [Acidobacteriota bacterium]|nr:segregation/condensation protein A [Blastocatellia bacterium]MDW8239382.1 segregation/condensation protein A [Acidobacteriota bacterium]
MTQAPLAYRDDAQGWEELDQLSSSYTVKLEIFEGPLDLLLHLIKREQVSIYDIPIARITEQYLEYLRLMQEMDIAVASDFLVMAATLIYIKTKMLLPRAPDLEEGEEAEDPRQQLVQQLLEYQKYKAAAEMLWSKAEVEQAIFVRSSTQVEGSEHEVAATVYDLFEAFRRTMERLKATIALEIEREEVTMAEKIAELRHRLKTEARLDITRMLEEARSTSELIAIFLAVLELVKQSVIQLIQQTAFGQIIAVRNAQPIQAEVIV